MAENTVPKVNESWKKHVATGIRKKFADKYDFGALSDDEVVDRHYKRFGKGMDPTAYQTKLNEVYAADYKEPSHPLMETVSAVAEAAPHVAQGIAPFVVPEVAKAAVKGTARAIPVASQVGFGLGHIANAIVDQTTIGQLQKTSAALPVEDRTQEYFSKLQPGLAQKGWSDEEIMDEARKRAANVSRGYQKTIASIDEDVQAVQEHAITEPARALADAAFLGVGAPAIEGLLTKGLQRTGLAKVGAAVSELAGKSPVGRIAGHAAMGALIGAPGMALQEGATEATIAAAANQTPQEIAAALVKGTKHGAEIGFKFGAAIGGGFGAVAEGVGGIAGAARAKRIKAEFKESQAQAELDAARLRGWQEFNAQQRAMRAKDEADALKSIAETADSFNPHTTSVPLEGSPAEIATSIIQGRHGEDAILSEAGLRAASRIEARIRLYQDANEAINPTVDLPRGERPLGRMPEMEPTATPARTPLEPSPVELPAEQPVAVKPGPVNPQELLPAPAALPEPTTAQRIETALEPVRKGEQSGYTFNPDTFETDATPGYVVSVTSKNVKNPNAEQIEKFREQMAPWIKRYREEGKRVSIGVFALEKKPGMFSIDLNVNVPTAEEAQAIGRITNQESFAHIGPDGNWIENVPVTPEVKTPAGTITEKNPAGRYADLEEGPGGELVITRLGTPPGELAVPQATGKALDAIVRHADRQQVPVTTRITQVAGPRGGMIPIEKMLPWYEQRGFKVVDSTKLPEGQMATATLRRDPAPPPAKKITMLEATRLQMEKDLSTSDAPSAQALKAPEVTPAPGRWHQLDLWADTNISAARERIKAREAEFPEAERAKKREAGFIGDRPLGKDPTSYDWADFADRVQIGVNVMLKHGLNKAEWIEHMVRELGSKFRGIAEQVYHEAVAAYQARRPNGVDAVRLVVDDYVHRAGLGRGATRHDVFPEVNPDFAKRVALAYDGLKSAKEGTPEYKAAKNSYEALNDEIEKQYQAMVDAGYTVEFTAQDPYPTSADMRADVAQNKRIRAFQSAESHHPFMTAEQTNKFRAVHDFFGHASEGYEFGPRGEDAAFRKHATTLSDAAIPALATETRGQNSWVNFMPKNAKLAPQERPFAEQKFALMPEWTYQEVIQARRNRAPKAGLTVGIATRGPVGEERAVVAAAEKLAQGVRPAKAPATVRARFVADGTDTIGEMMAISPESANWYHDDIVKMHKITEGEIPQIAEPGPRTLFDLLLAFTSPNTNVPQNYARALDLMRDFERTGKVPFLRRHGQETNMGSRKWVPRLNALIDRFGGDLNALREYLLAPDANGVYNVEKEFGPKVGPFTLNIQGIHDQITVDVWMVRRLRRLSGNLFKKVDGKRVLNEDMAPTAQEQRDIKEGIRELSKRTGLDPDAVQAVLWDNEKMVWERAGLMAPRIPFSVAAEHVVGQMKKNARQIERANDPVQQTLMLAQEQKLETSRRIHGR